ncbi:hypothetical protein N7474_004211 [Penicillium riverlandense]|uniref:uncharacterized protein n=1 Tax=Penicillium riverlandense TaxID=1903569 RepID=UPI0025484E96|nr:uncharacterized protein N7474_004211 [Penicillium riverlandense]KAJ5818620.1 hypothetical protein N7474_004211 [Penicillium riverlandense]
MPLQFPTVKQPNREEPRVKDFLESCRQGNLPVVEESLQQHQPNDAWLSHALTEAAKADQPVIMELLLEKGATIQTWTIYAAKSQAAWEILLKHGLEINNPMPWALVPLISVVVKNDAALLRWYLSLGADPNLGPPDTRRRGFVGSDDVPVPESGAALEEASRFCDTLIIDILVEHGAKLKNSLALHNALMRREGRILIMEHLLHLGVDVNHFGWLPPLAHGGTALHLAAYRGQVEEVQWLLEHGADPEIKGRMQMMPEDYALLQEHNEVVKLLRDWRGVVIPS